MECEDGNIPGRSLRMVSSRSRREMGCTDHNVKCDLGVYGLESCGGERCRLSTKMGALAKRDSRREGNDEQLGLCFLRPEI